MVDYCLYIVHLWGDSRVGWEGSREGGREGGRGMRNGLGAEGGRYACIYIGMREGGVFTH